MPNIEHITSNRVSLPPYIEIYWNHINKFLKKYFVYGLNPIEDMLWNNGTYLTPLALKVGTPYVSLH